MLITHDGEWVPVLKTVVPIERKGRPYLLESFIDISELKQAEDEKVRLESQLRHAQKMEAVGTLAGGIAHDFNNLLQAVQGYAELLLLSESLTESGEQNVQDVMGAAERGGELTRQLLTFSRKIESKLRPIDLNHEVSNVKELLTRTIPKMIQIELQLAEDLKTVNADPIQLEQALMNLALNSKDSMPEGGKLIISTENVTLDDNYSRLYPEALLGEHVLVTVADSGHGMDRETIEHIFDPFYTTKEVGHGTGLGLAMVYGTVKSHNGHIVCYSEVDKGTTFKIYLPVVEQEAEWREEEAEGDIEGGTETILLVDDEELIRKLGDRILTKFGYTVLTATDGESALAVYREEQQRIHLVILDLIMPGMGGRKCLEKLMKVNPSAKVLIASGGPPGGPTKESPRARAKGFVSKPYNLRQLLTAVRNALDGD